MLADARATGWSRRQIPPKHQHAQMLIADMTVNLLSDAQTALFATGEQGTLERLI